MAAWKIHAGVAARFSLLVTQPEDHAGKTYVGVVARFSLLVIQYHATIVSPATNDRAPESTDSD